MQHREYGNSEILQKLIIHQENGTFPKFCQVLGKYQVKAKLTSEAQTKAQNYMHKEHGNSEILQKLIIHQENGTFPKFRQVLGQYQVKAKLASEAQTKAQNYVAQRTWKLKNIANIDNSSRNWHFSKISLGIRIVLAKSQIGF